MVTTKTIEVCTCDRCHKGIMVDDRWTLRMKRLNIDREFDLCEDCEFDFKAFMMNKLHYEKETKVTVEVIEETEVAVEPIVKGDDTLSTVDDIDFRRGLPDKLKKFMQANNFTGKDMAVLVDVSIGTMYRWIHGEQDRVNSRTQAKLEKFIKDYNL